MKNNLLGLITVTLLVATSCKKKEYSTNSPTPTYPFYFNGTINGASVSLQAGASNYYLYTSYALDGNGVYDYAGEFRDKNTSTGSPNSLKIYVKDYRQYSLAPTQIDSTLLQGYYSLATPAGTASAFSVLFYDSLYNGTAQSFAYAFGDGGTSSQHRPTHLYGHPGIYTVSLNAQSTGACSSSLTNEVMVGQVGGRTQLFFVSNPTTATTVTLATTTGGGTGPGTYTFNWDFGDGNTGVSTSPTYTYTYATPGVYPLTLTRVDGANTTEICRRNFATLNATSCYANFYPTFITPVANPMNLANVTLEWHDASGNLYTSNNNSQPTQSMFKILSVSPYQNNTSGQPTKQIHAKVHCTLYNGTNTAVLDGDMVFSVAYL